MWERTPVRIVLTLEDTLFHQFLGLWTRLEGMLQLVLHAPQS